VVRPTSKATPLAAPQEAPPSPTPAALGDLDSFVAQTMKDWKVPGLGVAVVQNGKIILTKGYGLRDRERNLPVTPDTLFAIGSITKSLTVTTLGTLVDEGKLDWDKPVRDYLPGFTLYSEILTEHLTTRDMVTHRSGLPRHDLVWYASDFSRADIVRRLRYLEPNKDLRETFQYNNLMFMTAGYTAGQLAGGLNWEEAVRQRVLDPLGMTGSHASTPAGILHDRLQCIFYTVATRHLWSPTKVSNYCTPLATSYIPPDFSTG